MEEKKKHQEKSVVLTGGIHSTGKLVVVVVSSINTTNQSINQGTNGRRQLRFRSVYS